MKVKIFFLMENKLIYRLFKKIETGLSDPISAILLLDNFVIIGTMLGKVILSSLLDQKEIKLLDQSSENISGITYSDSDKCINISVGDKEILRFQINDSHPILIKPIKKYFINSTEEEHQKICEKTYIILSKDNLLKLEIHQPDEKEILLRQDSFKYEIKNISNMTTIKQGSLSMRNYSIPFDFNGRFFVWIEYLSLGKRRICLKDFNKENDLIFHYEIDKNFGHISFIKIIDEKHILIVRSLNICDIRKLNHDLTLIETFVHNGDKIYNINIFNFYQNDIIKDDNKSQIYDADEILVNSVQIKSKNTKITKNSSKLFMNKIYEHVSNHNQIIINKFNLNDSKNIMKNKVIVTLDIDGNVNWYENKEEKTLFNIYDLEDISTINKTIKKEKFLFNMGYEYYIKNNTNFFCITTDIGCLIIKK